MSKIAELLRRDFNKGLLVAATSAFFGGCEKILDDIANRPIRRNITSAEAADDIATYKNAVTAMKALPATDPRHWNNQANIHQNSCPHGNWFFLPWHRIYLSFFEQICRELTSKPKFALPYWNWGLSPSIPAPFWPSGTPLYNPRGATATSMADASLTGPAVLQSILAETNFQMFASLQSTAPRGGTGGGYGRLEQTPHNYVHGFVGGEMGTYQSPRDPVFWSHHNMIELCWVDWNIYRGNQNTNDTSWMNWEFSEFFDAKGNPTKMTTAVSLLLPLLSYRYDADVAGTPKQALQKAEHERISKLVRQGAPSKLEFENRFEIARDARAVVGKPEAFAIKVDSSALGSMLEPSGSKRLLLSVDGVTGPASPDFFVRVFLGNQPPTDLNINNPAYAGSFAFFGDAHGGHGENHKLQFLVDVSEAARRMQQQGALLKNGALNVFLVPVAFPGQDLKVREFSLGRLVLSNIK